jgi:hypothetical protein
MKIMTSSKNCHNLSWRDVVMLADGEECNDAFRVVLPIDHGGKKSSEI